MKLSWLKCPHIKGSRSRGVDCWKRPFRKNLSFRNMRANEQAANDK